MYVLNCTVNYLEKIITYLLLANSISFVLGNLRWYFLYWELKVNDFHLQYNSAMQDQGT